MQKDEIYVKMDELNDAHLAEQQRRQEHNFIVPNTQNNYMRLRNAHTTLLSQPPTSTGSTHCMRGDVTYFHYGIDGQNDIGWGCAYRTLQSLCSWILAKRGNDSDDACMVPTIKDIQQTLCDIGDKSKAFVGSRDWIGALEVFFVVDTLYDVSCKILHIPRGDNVKKFVSVLAKYFDDFGGFVMMGGDMDAASKGIAGVHISGNQAYLLVVDPHFTGVAKSAAELCERGYIRWQHTSEFVDSSFYNLCLPQLK